MKKENKIKEKDKKSAYSISDVTPTTTEKKIINTESESAKFIIILLVIVAFIVMLWLINNLKNEKNNDDNNETEVTIQYKEIIVGNMLNQKYDEYFVLAYNKDEYKKDMIDYLISSYVYSHSTVGSYTIDLDKAYNLPAIATESNFKGENIENIKFKGTTLLNIKKGKIAEAIEGADAIATYLKKLNSAQK